jgi:hypothetical protein
VDAKLGLSGRGKNVQIVFENKVLRRIFELKNKEGSGGLRKLLEG